MNQGFPSRPINSSIIRLDTCKGCKFSVPNSQAPGTLECRRYPPSIHVFKFQNANQNTNIVEFKEYTTFSKVNPDHYCGEYKPRIEVT